MKIMKLVGIVAVIAIVAVWAGCGGSSSDDSTSSDSGTGTASVTSLSSIPTMDLSSYDSSAGSSANLAALLSASKGVSKGIGEGLRDVGKSSRAGCEANMHKQEVFRMSQQAQLDRCYAEAMETAGLITIPADAYALYSLTPPEMSNEEEAGMCDGIPAERVKEKAECLSNSEESGGKTMLIRLGRFANELRIDMCSVKSGVTALDNEATYTASGSQYTADVTRKGTWGGETEGGTFHVVVDLGATGVVTDGIATIGTDGLVNAAGQMAGGFGRGTITFERVGADSSNRVYGTFAGDFTDPFSGTATSFTGRAYARFSNAGCAKFSFTGSMPAMRVSDMIPFNVSAADQAMFLAQFAAELGITGGLTTSSMLCPNPDFNPETSNATLVKPMLPMTGTSCGTVTHTGIECFGIVNGTTTGSFGETIVTQTFTVVANNSTAAVAAYFAEVNAFDLLTLAEPPANAEAIAFVRNWDCAGPFTTIDFSGVTPAVMETAMNKCRAIEEKARGNDGMGGYNCGQEEQMNGVQDMANTGGGADAFGAYGGELAFSNADTCGAYAPQLPQKLFVNPVNPDTKKYCFGLEGSCSEFTLVGEAASGLNIGIGNITGLGAVRITAITYQGGPPPTAAIVTFTGANSCNIIYSINRFDSFQGGSGGFGGSGGGDQPGEGGFIPGPCVLAGLTDPTDANACMQLCNKPGTDCSK